MSSEQVIAEILDHAKGRPDHTHCFVSVKALRDWAARLSTPAASTGDAALRARIANLETLAVANRNVADAALGRLTALLDGIAGLEADMRGVDQYEPVAHGTCYEWADRCKALREEAK